MLALSMRRRPKRSARSPNSSPPSAEEASVSAFSNPAVVRLMLNARIRCVSTIEYSSTSNASSIQPREAAMSTRRCAGVAALQRKAARMFVYSTLA